MVIRKLFNRVKFASIKDETVLSKKNRLHRELIADMNRDLYEIWGYAKAGSLMAEIYMHSKSHNRLVQLELDFQNDDIPDLHRRATYKAYKSVVGETKPLLRKLRKGGVA